MMNRGGLCDVCVDPGHCCRDVFLYCGSGSDAIDAPMSFERAEHIAMRRRLPFRPAYQLANGTWKWWCTALDPRTGRCSAYASRPQLCRDFGPGSEDLCVHYVPPSKVEPAEPIAQ